MQMITEEIVTQSETTEQDRTAVARLRALLGDIQYSGLPQPTLIGPTGATVPLTAAIIRVLTRVLDILASGADVIIEPKATFLSTGEAAERLGMSRSYLLKLLESGEIPFTRVGTHRRIHLSDVISYSVQRARRRRKQLERLIAESDAAGLYDKPEMEQILNRTTGE